MKLLDDYLELQRELFEYFGYVEDWRVIPVDDARAYYWRLYGEGPGEVRFAETPELLDDPDGNYYANEIYTQRFLPRWIYRGPEYTMVVVDTNVDDNKFLQIFSNDRERPGRESVEAYGVKIERFMGEVID